ncbi:MAG TPA: DNA topoisomerase IB [Devosiaceae bacterium]|jgi:DNA topoisomerase-1
MKRKLITVTRADLTIARVRRGRGFCYRAMDGSVVCDAAFKARAAALAIPPAWRDVRLAIEDRAHIQCVGTDEAGRVQYIYHPDWEMRRAARKQRRLGLLTSALPKVRRRVSHDLMAEAGSMVLAQAIAVALIDRTAMRVGRERYLEENGTRGAGTLFARDVTVTGAEVCTNFTAKGGKAASYCFTDKRLAAAMTRIKTLPGKRLLVYRDATGKVRPLKTGMINAYLQEIAGVEISAKDFRTLHASAMAGEALAEVVPAPSESGRKRQIAAVTRQVAEFLHNTPMISRKSYISPCLFRLFDEGKLQALWAAGDVGVRGLRERERRLSAVMAGL